MKKKIITLVVSLILLAVTVLPACALTNVTVETPYEAYVYNNDTRPVTVPTPYTVEKTVNAQTLGIEKFTGISDIFHANGEIFIVERSQNKIVITDDNFNYKTTISGFDNNGTPDTFNEPASCFVNDTKIYIADSKNSRIVVLNKADYSLATIFKRPEINVLKKDYTYTPLRIVVDNADRMYILAEGINEGMIRLDETGKFTSFFGAPTVEYDVLDLIWRKFATKAQREQMEQFIPTEYSSLLIDKKGFIYATSATSESTPVAKINTNGENVLTELQGEFTEYGDKSYLLKSSEEDPETSNINPYFSDIAIGDGVYCLLDSKRSKIYVYSNDGYLLYVFGGAGTQRGTFDNATAIEIVNNKLIVSDGNKGTITVFRFTDFGACVQKAIELYNAGDYKGSYNTWKKAYNYCSNYTPAISGMAKIDIANGKASKAMDDLKNVHAHKLYSAAFESWRNDIIRDYFVWAVGVIIVLYIIYRILAKFIHKAKWYKKYHESNYYKGQKFATYTMFHPFDGYWDLKREKRGSMSTAFIIFAMFIICYAIRDQFSGYVTTNTISSQVNVIYDVVLIVIPIMFWVISNWCFSTLMEGEGTFKDIFMVTCYAMKPYVVLSIPLLLLSHVLTIEETMFYGVINTFCWIWMLALFFFGMMVTHNYSLGKAILTAILSIVGICIIVFILLLVISIVSGMYEYFYGIVKELVFRTY